MSNNASPVQVWTHGLRKLCYLAVAGVFRHFEKDGEFFCFAGQSTQAVTGMYNLNRASQVAFPGEEILDRARSFSYLFLREKQAADQVVDKWIITKDLPGEVSRRHTPSAACLVLSIEAA